MAGYIEDRWWTKRPDPETGKKRKTARYGKGKRWRVAGIPGVRDRSFANKTGDDGADAWLADAQSKSRSGDFIDPRSGDLTLAEYIEGEWWPSVTGDVATLQTVKGRVWTHIVPHLGHQRLNTIKVPQLRAFLKELDGTTGPGTVHAAWGYLSSILQTAVEGERIHKNYCTYRTAKAALPKPPERKARAWQRDRIFAVQAALHPRFQIMVDLGVGAGLRQGEVFGLAVDDVDADAAVIHVRRQVRKIGSKLVFAPPKGGKTRDVPLPQHIARQLKAHLDQYPARQVTLPWIDPETPSTEKQREARAPQTHTLIVTAVKGGAIRRDSWNLREWKPALAAAGVIAEPEISVKPKNGRAQGRTVKKYEESRENGFHALRHTFASVQLDARESVVAVSKWLGHADPSITLRIYAHMMPEADGRGRAAMDAWFAAGSETISPDSPQLPQAA
ncbi:tyrosine-type recombinase/integrase [Streptomyces noursei]|uniref:tyrosine-type recombinase/integrase n=1 Tax=Streptomyces noursei TaxID=1971 RepID=UPI0035D6E265